MDKRILSKISVQDAVDLTCEMIRYDTTNPPGNERPLAEKLVEMFKEHSFEAETHVFEEGRANLTARWRGNGERKALLFNGHLDVVPVGQNPWKHPAFSGVVEEGKIYGRGASDMKSGLAAMMVAAFAVKASGLSLKGDLVFAGSAGEETDSIGAKLFFQQNGLDGVGAIIVGEPSSCELNVAEKGCLWIKVTTYGKTAHGAFPEQGVNAIAAMNDFLTELRAYKFNYSENALLGHPSMNISTIQGGVKTNVVPDKCELTVDIRTVPGQKHENIVNDLNAICRKLKSANPAFEGRAESINDRPAVETASDHPFVQLGRKVINEEFGRDSVPRGVNFFTDAAIFLPTTNLPALLYGPGDASMAHQPDEHVSVERIKEAVHFYAAMIERYLIL